MLLEVHEDPAFCTGDKSIFKCELLYLELSYITNIELKSWSSALLNPVLNYIIGQSDANLFGLDVETSRNFPYIQEMLVHLFFDFCYMNAK